MLGFAGTESASGLNVAGNYVVDGVAEAATGTGQVLSGDSGNAHTDGLQVQVTLNGSQIVSGSDADLTVTRGLADRLNQVLSRHLDPVSGRFDSIDKQYDDQIGVIDETIARQNALLQAKKDSLLQQFAAMEETVSRLNSLSQQLSAQFLARRQTTSTTKTK